MFQKNEFKAALVRKGMTLENIAKTLNTSTATLSRKINGKGDFFRHEIETISKLLKLSSEEILRIFFA